MFLSNRVVTSNSYIIITLLFSAGKKKVKIPNAFAFRIFGPDDRIRTCGIPVAVPCVRLADGAAALPTDRCHSFGSLASATGGGRLAPPQQVPCFVRKMPQESAILPYKAIQPKLTTGVNFG